MTCIVAISDGVSNTVVAGDTQATGGWSKCDRDDHKVFRNNQVVMGFTSSYRMGQLLQYNLELPDIPVGTELHPWMVRTFIPLVRTCLKEGGWAKVDNNKEIGGNFIVAIEEVIFEVQSDFQVSVPSKPYAAVGCGEELALGSLYTTEDMALTPLQRIEYAIGAADAFSAGVNDTYYHLETNPNV